MTALQATGLVKRFGAVAAIDGIDLTVAPGEIRGLLGPNGAGKSTLLRVLFGLAAADAGTVALAGPTAGFVEEPAFYPYLSGQVNLELLADLDGTPREAIRPALEQVDLAGRAGDAVGTYSSGMRQRLGVAAALLRSPRVLILDEPAAGLDPAGVRDLGRLLRELADGDAAVLISSHHIAEIDGLCDSYTVLRHGRVVWDGSAAQLAAAAPAASYRLRTSDDRAATGVAADGVVVTPRPGGLDVQAAPDDLDAYVIALGRAGIAVRHLELGQRPLERLYFALTEAAP